MGRYKFTDLEISKTKIAERIKKGEFTGWDDIRLPLLRNFKRRGYLPEAFAKMAEKRGLSEVDKVISKEDYFQILSLFNRQIIKDMGLKVQAQIEGEKVRVFSPKKDDLQAVMTNLRKIDFPLALTFCNYR